MTSAREFPMDPLSVGAARRFAEEQLGGTPYEVLEPVVLMVSELATNCIRHAKTGFGLRISRDPDTIRVEVSDPAGGTPTMQSPGPDDPTGRGLRIVEVLSDAWGVERSSAAATTVWFEIGTMPPSRRELRASRAKGGASREAIGTTRLR